MDLSLQLQISVAAGAMRDVVLPAMGLMERQVQEQAGLVLALLDMMGEQVPHLEQYQKLEFDHYVALAGEILALLPVYAAFRPNLSEAMELSRLVTGSAARGEAVARFRAVIGDIAGSALSHDGARPSAIGAAILAAARTETRRERAWLARTGFEPDPRELLSILELCAGKR